MRRPSPLRFLAIACAVLEVDCTAYTLNCRPGEPSTDCCIKKFPLSPVESCGVELSEANKVLFGMATIMTLQEGDQPKEGADEFVNNQELPEWKQRCIKGYYDCVNEGWTGDCYACIRRCEGQQAWPLRMCRPRRTR